MTQLLEAYDLACIEVAVGGTQSGPHAKDVRGRCHRTPREINTEVVYD